MYTDSLSPKRLFRDAALGLHTDSVKDYSDKDKSTAAGYMGALSDIMNELKEKQDNIPAGTCLTLFNAVGPENWKQMDEIVGFMKRQHGIEERDEKGDNTDGKKESDGNGNKSDDPEKRDSNLPLIGLATTTLGGLHAYGKCKKKEAEKEKEEIAQKKLQKQKPPSTHVSPAPVVRRPHITGIGSYYR
jgi:hypothetical protein